MSGAVLQDTAAFYKARCDVAEDHFFKGEISQALDILWDLKLKSDLGLHRRTLVYLLIACNLDVRFRKRPVLADERLELLKQLQRDGYPPNETILLTEKHARKAMTAMDMEEAELKRAKEQTAKPGDRPSSVLENSKVGEQSKTRDQMDTDDGQSQQLPQIPGLRAKSSSIIKGMYTDQYGQVEKAAQVEKATGKEPGQLLNPNPTSEIDTAK